MKSAFKRNNDIFYWKSHKVRYIITLVLGVLAVFLLIFHTNTTVANFISEHIANPYKIAVGTINGFLPFSMAEIFVVGVVLFLLIYIVLSIIFIVKAKKDRKMTTFLKKSTTVVISGLILYNMYTILWGVNYYVDSTIVKMGIVQREITVEELGNTTAFFVEKLNESAHAVSRDENGVFNEDKDEIFAEGKTIYNNLEAEYSYLEWIDIPPKEMLFSEFFSYAGYTGIYFPYTAEANVNSDPPPCFLPSTIAHELSHVRGVAPENDCNFLAILACEKSENPAYVYSGWLLGFVNLSNALYSADNELWNEVVSSLDSVVWADLSNNNEYWKQFESPVEEVVDAVYDNFLQVQGQDDGIKSYGRVVDLLVAWYLPKI